MSDPKPLGEGRHVSFTLKAGGAHSRCVAFGGGSSLPVGDGEPADVAVKLEIDRWNGSLSPRLVMREARACVPGTIELLGEPACFADGLLGELERDLERPCPERASSRTVRDLRGSGIAGVLGDLVATGEPVLAVCAHAPHRAGALAPRVGGFTLTSWAALEDDPDLAAAFPHVVAIDPPPRPLLAHPSGEGWTHLAWGTPELDFALRIHEWDFNLREPLTAVYRALRAVRVARGEAGETLLRGDGPQPRSAALAGRLVRVLTELGLADLERGSLALEVADRPQRTALERSAAFMAYQRRFEDGQQYLTSSNPRRQAA
jgi:single-stranded-DNA-specific exonuclease